METILIILLVCIILITIAVLVMSVFLILTLAHFKEAGKEIERLVKRVQNRVDVIDDYFTRLFGFTNQRISPWINSLLLGFSTITYILMKIKKITKKRRKENE